MVFRSRHHIIVLALIPFGHKSAGIDQYGLKLGVDGGRLAK